MTTQHWGGYIGLATARGRVVRLVRAVINSTFGRTVVPLFPLTGRARGRTLTGCRGGARDTPAGVPHNHKRGESR